MGAEPWSYVTDYQDDLDSALQELRQTEFEAGRYNGGSPEQSHSSIEEAMEDADADGTASILDIESVSEEPDDGLEPPLCGVAYPLTPAQLVELFGTTKPDLATVRGQSTELWRLIGRGCCMYVLVYDEGEEKPTKIFWAGYSYD